MRDYLIDKKEEIKEFEIYPREYKSQPSREFINVIAGPRRVGKTFYLYYLIKKNNLKDDEFIFINFEDDEIKNLNRKEKTKLIKYHVEIHGKEPKYIFLDEIQELENWDSFIYSLVEKKKYALYITGSSSKLLSKEIATQLRGRSITTIMFPFSFKEFLNVKKFEVKPIMSTIKRSKIKHHLEEYLKKGGFPQIVLGKINEKEFFKEYVNVILYKDIVERFSIENIDAMRFLILSAIQSNGKEFSINKIYKQIKEKISVGNKTLYQYSSYLEDVFFAFYLYKFNYSYKKALLSIPKIYVNDPGLFYNFYKNSISRSMENAVFIKLKKSELEGKIELYYFKDYQNHEVDFVIKEGFEVRQLIQVTYASHRDEIERREIRSLIKASDLLKCKNLLVITWDYESKEEIKGKTIRFVPLWKWLLKIDQHF